jgi:hypothetical protein
MGKNNKPYFFFFFPFSLLPSLIQKTTPVANVIKLFTAVSYDFS